MGSSPAFVGFIQASGIALYVSLFALLPELAGEWLGHIEPEPRLGIPLFLMAFIVSATLTSSMMFAYPIYLFFHEQKRRAVLILLSTILWLITCIALYAGAWIFFGGEAVIEQATLIQQKPSA